MQLMLQITFCSVLGKVSQATMAPEQPLGAQKPREGTSHEQVARVLRQLPFKCFLQACKMYDFIIAIS